MGQRAAYVGAMSQPTPWLTRDEAAEYLSCSIRTIDRLRRAGTLKDHRCAGLVRIKRADLDRVLRPLVRSK